MSKLSPRLRIAVLERDDYRCVYCGSASRTTMLEVDHVLPRALGGEDVPTNLVTACRQCNAGKSAALVALPALDIVNRPLPTWFTDPIRRARPTRRRTREEVWPVQGPDHRRGFGPATRGWPMPDGAWDQLCVKQHADGFLPWAIWQREPGWYLGFYTCDEGHAWTCGHGVTASWSEIFTYRVSPIQQLPATGYLKLHLGVRPEEIDLRVVEYPRTRVA